MSQNDLVLSHSAPVANDAVDALTSQILEVVGFVVVVAPTEQRQSRVFDFRDQRRISQQILRVDAESHQLLGAGEFDGRWNRERPDGGGVAGVMVGVAASVRGKCLSPKSAPTQGDGTVMKRSFPKESWAE